MDETILPMTRPTSTSMATLTPNEAVVGQLLRMQRMVKLTTSIMSQRMDSARTFGRKALGKNCLITQSVEIVVQSSVPQVKV